MKRRILSFALASAMVVGPAAGAFADAHESTEVKTNNVYVQGTSETTFSPNMSLTREQVATMIQRAYALAGSESEANYDDASSISAWAAEAVATLQDEGLMEGTGDDMFSPKRDMTRAELATVLVRAYERSTGEELPTGDASFDDVSGWSEEYIEKAATAGFVLGTGEGNFAPDRVVTRAESVTMINRMLEIDELAEGMADKLENKFTDLDDAAWFDGTQAIVVSSAFNYTVNEEGKLVIVATVESVSVSSEEDVATVSAVVDNASEGEMATVEIFANGDTSADAAATEEVEIVDGEVSAEISGLPAGDHVARVTVGDSYKDSDFAITISTPAVESVSAINAKEVEIKFNKAVDESTVISGTALNNITITQIGSAQAIGTEVAELSEDGKTLKVTAQAATGNYFDGQYAVTVPVAVTDEDGNAIEAYSQILTVDDTTRPTIMGVAYPDNNKAEIKFSEPLNDDGNVSFSDSNITQDAFTVNDSSITVDLTSANLSTDTDYTVTIVGAEDGAGNLVSPNPVNVTVQKTTVDEEDPEIVSVEAINDTNLVVTFSEAVDTSGTIFKLDVAETGFPFNVTTNEATVNDDKTEVNVDLSAAGFTPSGLARVDITEYQDLSGNPGTITDSAYNELINFTADTDAPEVATTTVENMSGTRYIVVEFDEDVTVTPAAMPTVTYVADGVQKTLAGGIVSAAVTPHDKDGDGNDDSVKIDTENYDGSNSILPEGAYTITLPANLVADAAGNNSASTTVDVTVGDISSGDTTKPTIQGGAAGITIVDNDTISVQFSESVTNATALNVSNYTIDGVEAFDSAIFDGDKTKVELTLKDGIIDLTGSRLVEVKNIEDVAGNVMDDASFSKTLTENVNPEMTKAQIESTTQVKVTFSELIAHATIEAAGAGDDFEVYVDGVKATISAVDQATAGTGNNDDEFIITFGSPAITDLSKPVTVKILSGNNITDANGNALETTGEITAVQ